MVDSKAHRWEDLCVCMNDSGRVCEDPPHAGQLLACQLPCCHWLLYHDRVHNGGSYGRQSFFVSVLSQAIIALPLTSVVARSTFRAALPLRLRRTDERPDGRTDEHVKPSLVLSTIFFCLPANTHARTHAPHLKWWQSLPRGCGVCHAIPSYF